MSGMQDMQSYVRLKRVRFRLQGDILWLSDEIFKPISKDINHQLKYTSYSGDSKIIVF